MKKIILLLALFSAQAFATSLPQYVRSQKSKIESLMTEKYEYTFKVDYDTMKCLERTKWVEETEQKVGVCLINAQAIEESARVVFSVTVASNYDGTGETEREISIALVDYNL